MYISYIIIYNYIYIYTYIFNSDPYFPDKRTLRVQSTWLVYPTVLGNRSHHGTGPTTGVKNVNPIRHSFVPVQVLLGMIIEI